MSAQEIFNLCVLLFFAVFTAAFSTCAALTVAMILMEKLETYFAKRKRDAK